MFGKFGKKKNEQLSRGGVLVYPKNGKGETVEVMIRFCLAQEISINTVFQQLKELGPDFEIENPTFAGMINRLQENYFTMETIDVLAILAVCGKFDTVDQICELRLSGLDKIRVRAAMIQYLPTMEDLKDEEIDAVNEADNSEDANRRFLEICIKRQLLTESMISGIFPGVNSTE